MSQISFDTASLLTPVQFRYYMEEVLSRLSDEQINLLLDAIERDYQTKQEEAIARDWDLEDTTWRAEDLREKVKNKATLYRADRRICAYFLRIHFIDRLEALKPDVKGDKSRLRELQTRIQLYQDIVNQLNQKHPGN